MPKDYKELAEMRADRFALFVKNGIQERIGYKWIHCPDYRGVEICKCEKRTLECPLNCGHYRRIR